MAKRFLILIFSLSMSFVLTGCDKDVFPAKGEIDKYEVVQVFGIDRCKEDPSNVEITLIAEKAKMSSGKGGESGGGAKSYEILSSTGKTVFEAERILKSHTDKKMFFGYTEYFLIGEDAAKDDIVKYFDFVIRGHEIRLSPKVFIVSGCSIKDFVNQTSSTDKYVVDMLQNIESEINDMSNFGQLQIIDVANMLNDDSSAAIIPVLKCGDIKDEKIVGGELPEKDPETCGYAIIKDFKLVGYIEEDISRGYNFLVGKVKSSPISIKDVTGMNVCLEVINEITDVKARFNGDTLEGVTYKTHIYSNIVEQQSKDDLVSQEDIDDLSKKQSDVIKAEMEAVIGLSKKYEIDCTNLGDKIRIRHPLKWEKIKDKWKEVYPNIKIDVEVTSDLRRIYDIAEPIGYKFES
ncbi:MAG: Ger(x)C family spore germination protein [Oscillospiraceae bacterium]